MQLSVSSIVLAAKQHEIEELRRLGARSELVAVIGHMVHVLQLERGATSIFLASQGGHFADTRQAALTESQAVEQRLRTGLAAQLQSAAHSARFLSLMAWALLGLDGLPALRASIDRRAIPAREAIDSYGRIIAGLVALVFEVADSAVDPGISRLLVALFNLVQGKEQAGQERALGGLCFASGQVDAADRDRMTDLIESQERSFQLFAEFADEALAARWQAAQDAPFAAQLERLRRVLHSTRATTLDAAHNEKWFDVCSARLVEVWSLQCLLVEALQGRCAALVAQAQQALTDAEGLLRTLRDNPPAARLDDNAMTGAEGSQALVQVLKAQAERLAGMEADLDTARRVLDERKLIERAKGILMERFQISEDEAHVMMRKASMDQNRKLVEVAQAALSLPAFLVPPRPGK
ncbi:nitrate- and nitrite sensing domain-containing protein [Uliginosibacterium sp. H1]|uniref:nitrate- and nitrite sensing domain-containing protein n=1 Tax=Uliginosibacterium sp. H1 TaxID=3114757 RepID=UPI002E17949B|nr:nitrate- and nitrite sensing domain-containing protein [Uliginosibacterium sp. H1]